MGQVKIIMETVDEWDQDNVNMPKMERINEGSFECKGKIWLMRVFFWMTH